MLRIAVWNAFCLLLALEKPMSPPKLTDGRWDDDATAGCGVVDGTGTPAGAGDGAVDGAGAVDGTADGPPFPRDAADGNAEDGTGAIMTAAATAVVATSDAEAATCACAPSEPGSEADSPAST